MIQRRLPTRCLEASFSVSVSAPALIIRFPTLGSLAEVPWIKPQWICLALVGVKEGTIRDLPFVRELQTVSSDSNRALPVA